jgi:hypothetical protein
MNEKPTHKPYTFAIRSKPTAQAKNCKRVCLANAENSTKTQQSIKIIAEIVVNLPAGRQV